MKPGRELDALVAEKVMGWSREHSECGLPPGVYGSDNIEAFPHYSTDISAAWEVAKHLNKINPLKMFSDTSERWFVKCGPVERSAEELPHAIVLTAVALAEAQDA